MSTLEIDATPVADITEPADGRDAPLVTSRELYYRWERQQWSVAAVDVRRDTPAWQALRDFYRDELLHALAELEIGEVAVTETLHNLVEGSPTHDDRVYLCTQVADEARHVRFFQAYLHDVAGLDATAPDTPAPLADSDYARFFAPQLRATTAAARRDGGAGAWYAALVHYHLVTEGILAATALRTTRQLVRRLPLPALDEGLTNVIRDESRHVSFGLSAAARGVRAGQREAVLDAYFAGIEMAAHVLVGPRRRQPTPVLRMALRHKAAQLTEQWSIARDRTVRQLRAIGLEGSCADAGRAWDAACERAVDAYEEHWGTAHPVRLMGEHGAWRAPGGAAPSRA